MKTLNFKKQYFALLLMMFFSIVSIKASNESCENSKEKIEISFEESTHYLYQNNSLNDDVIIVKNGKFWRALRDFLIGFGEGYLDIELPANENNSNGNINGDNFSNEEMQNIKDYALKYIRTKENALKMANQIKDLIQNDKKTVSKAEVLNILNPKSSGRPAPQWLRKLLDDIFKPTTTHDSGSVIDNNSNTKPNVHSKPSKLVRKKRFEIKKEVNSKRKINDFDINKPQEKKSINWRKVGRFVGKIVRLLT